MNLQFISNFNFNKLKFRHSLNEFTIHFELQF
jgi:hypothetical protein